MRSTEEEKEEADLYRLEADLDLHQILIFRDLAERTLLEELEASQAVKSGPIPNLPNLTPHTSNVNLNQEPQEEQVDLAARDDDVNQDHEVDLVPIVILEPSTPPRSMTSASLASDSDSGLHPDQLSPSTMVTHSEDKTLVPSAPTLTADDALPPIVMTEGTSGTVSTSHQAEPVEEAPTTSPPTQHSAPPSNQHQSWLAWGLHGVYSGLFGGQSGRSYLNQSSNPATPLRTPNASEMEALFTILKPPAEANIAPPSVPKACSKAVFPSHPDRDQKLARVVLSVSTPSPLSLPPSLSLPSHLYNN